MTNVLENYRGFLKGWSTSKLGVQPTADQLEAVQNLGARPGKQAFAIAMGLRDEGVTNSQIVMAVGNPQLNKMRGFITDAFLKRLPAAAGDSGHTVYKLAITPKGLQRIERSKAAAAKLAEAGEAVTAEKPAKKAKAKAKAKKATAAKLPKVSPVDASTGEPEATANEATPTTMPPNTL